MIESLNEFEIVGVIDTNSDVGNSSVPYLGLDEDWETIKSQHSGIKAVITTDQTSLRHKMVDHYGTENLAQLIPGTSYCSRLASIGRGSIVQRGVNITSDVSIDNKFRGDDAIIGKLEHL